MTSSWLRNLDGGPQRCKPPPDGQAQAAVILMMTGTALSTARRQSDRSPGPLLLQIVTSTSAVPQRWANGRAATSDVRGAATAEPVLSSAHGCGLDEGLNGDDALVALIDLEGADGRSRGP